MSAESGGAMPQSDEDDIIAQLDAEDELVEAVYQFNRSPRNGIQQLCEVNGLQPTPQNIAHLMHTVPGLLGDKIGDFLSRKQNHQALLFYFNELDLKRPFIAAMRLALGGSLHLPGEAESIDRVVESFAEVYTVQNAGSFPSVNTAYILAFALIMLNSDLHNPNVKQKITLPQFTENCRSTLSKEDVDDRMLTVMYEEIRSEAFAFRSESTENLMAMSAPRLRGTLKKKSVRWNSFWTEHFFVLANSCLYYFKNGSAEESNNPLGMIQLVQVQVSNVPKKPCRIYLDGGNKDLQFIKFEKRAPRLVRGIKSMFLEAPNKRSAQKWLYRIRQSVVVSNFSNQASAHMGRQLSPSAMGSAVSETGATDLSP